MLLNHVKQLKIKKYFRRTLTLAAALSGALILLMPSIATATDYSSEQFTDPNPQPGDDFGYSLSLSNDGTIAVIGAPNATVNGNTFEGAAYVFVNSDGSWNEAAQLAPTDLNQYDRFGDSVSMSADGSEIIVGAFYGTSGEAPTTQTGNAYIFNEPAGGWAAQDGSIPQIPQAVEFAGSDSQVGDEFGWSVALSSDGSTAIVGATSHGSQDQGEAYVFDQPSSGWGSEPAAGWGNNGPNGGQVENEDAILTPSASNVSPNTFFGWSVALSSDGSTAMVGAPGAGTTTTLPGSAYEYTEPAGGWTGDETLTQSATLNSSDGVPNDYFGYSVGLSGDGQTMVVGAPNHEVGANSSAGAAYVFTNSDGTLSQSDELPTPEDNAAGDLLGFSVAIASDSGSILIGSPDTTVNGNSDEGVVYNYLPNGDGTWSVNNELFPSSDGPNQDFGYDVTAVNSQTLGNVFIGAPALTTTSGDDNSNANEAQNFISSTNLLNASPLTDGAQDSSDGGSAYLFDLSPPVISSFSPTIAEVGDQVTISGSHLENATSVAFNGKTAAIVSDSNSKITTTIPAGATSGYITVVTPSGSTASATQFTVSNAPAPTISSFSPSSQGEGDKVVIKGTGLLNAQVSINGQSLQITKDTKKAIDATLPLNAVTGYLSVSTVGGTAQSSSPITVLAPSITSITKSGYVGSTITIKGKDLAGVDQVLFNGVAAQQFLSGDSDVLAVVPSGATSGYVTVISPSGQAVSAKVFTVL